MISCHYFCCYYTSFQLRHHFFQKVFLGIFTQDSSLLHSLHISLPLHFFNWIILVCLPQRSALLKSWDFHQYLCVSYPISQSCLTLQPHGQLHTRLPYPSPLPEVHSNSCPLSWWCHPTILSSVIPFSFCPQSFLASQSFPMSRLFVSGCQSTEVSASSSVLPMNIRGWFPLGLTGMISLQSKGLSSDFPRATVQRHQFFGALIVHDYWKNHRLYVPLEVMSAF